MSQNQEKPYIRYWATGPENSPNARFSFLTPGGGESKKTSPEEAGNRLRTYYASNPEMELINGSLGNDSLNRTLTQLENERFLSTLKRSSE